MNMIILEKEKKNRRVYSYKSEGYLLINRHAKMSGKIVFHDLLESKNFNLLFMFVLSFERLLS